MPRKKRARVTFRKGYYIKEKLKKKTGSSDANLNNPQELAKEKNELSQCEGGTKKIQQHPRSVKVKRPIGRPRKEKVISSPSKEKKSTQPNLQKEKTVTDVIISQCLNSDLPLFSPPISKFKKQRRCNRKGGRVICLKTDPEPFNKLIDTQPELHSKEKTVEDVEFSDFDFLIKSSIIPPISTVMKGIIYYISSFFFQYAISFKVLIHFLNNSRINQ